MSKIARITFETLVSQAISETITKLQKNINDMKHETNQSLRVTSLHHTKKDKLAKNQKSIETKTVDSVKSSSLVTE